MRSKIKFQEWLDENWEKDNMEVCKWKINEVCCNDRSPDLADYPYPRSKCESKEGCKFFEKEDGIIKG